MVHAFVTVNVGAGEAQVVCDQVAEFDGVAEVHVVAGQYDVIAEIDGPEIQSILATVSNHIGAIDGVMDTKTYISLSGM